MERRAHVLPASRPVVAVLLAAALALGGAACGDDDEPTTGGDSGTTAPSSDDGTSGGYDYGGTKGADDGGEAGEGTIVAADFSLTDVTVGPGDPIKLKNEGDVAHTATADDGEFDLGNVSPGETSDPGTAPDEPGSYAFHCEIHPNMTATLTVEG